MLAVKLPEVEAREWYVRHGECKPLLDNFVEMLVKIVRYKLYLTGKKHAAFRIPLVREMIAFVIASCANENDPIPLAVIHQHIKAALRAAGYENPHMGSLNILRTVRDMEIVKCVDERCVPTERAYLVMSLTKEFIDRFIDYIKSRIDIDERARTVWEKLEFSQK